MSLIMDSSVLINWRYSGASANHFRLENLRDPTLESRRKQKRGVER